MLACLLYFIIDFKQSSISSQTIYSAKVISLKNILQPNPYLINAFVKHVSFADRACYHFILRYLKCGMAPNLLQDFYYPKVRRTIRISGLLSDSQETYPRVKASIQQLGGLSTYQNSYLIVKSSIRVLGPLSNSQETYPRIRTAIQQLGGLSASQRF